jgi:hypothetical protein
MRLYYQLTDTEKKLVLNFCTNLVLKDLISGDMKFDLTSEDAIIKNKIEAELEYIDTLADEQAKRDHLLGNTDISLLIHQTAKEIAQGTIYVEPDQMVICPETIEEFEHEPKLLAEPVHEEEDFLEEDFFPKKDPKILN